MGSPPHVRGKEVFDFYFAGVFGITPACAGKSNSRCPVLPLSEDHPRMCGEKDTVGLSSTNQVGSPPHVRGKGSPWLCLRFLLRITPACAGKRNPCWNRWAITQDHPRMCGEKLSDLPPQKSTLGSPPHVRGKVNRTFAIPASKGITPACAGKRSTKKRFGRVLWDHPRMCGEKGAAPCQRFIVLGSPPHVRGKV